MSTGRWKGQGRRLAAAVAVVVVMVTLGGCNVTVGNSERDQQRSAAERLLGDGSVSIDLADPPTREDLAVPEGRKTVFLERDDREPFDVTVTFRDGSVLTTPASVLGVHTDGPGTPPHGLTIRRDDMTLDDLQAALSSAVEGLGVDPGEVEQLMAEARSTEGGQADLVRSVPTGVESPDRLTIEPVVTALEGRVSVNYLVEWKP